MVNNDFLIEAINNNETNHLFALSKSDRDKINAIQIKVDQYPGFPCRVSLEDAQIGESIIALPYIHHDVKSPYYSSGPIFVRKNIKTAQLKTNEVPNFLSHRFLSVRAYNNEAMMIDAATTQGTALKSLIQKFFANVSVSYLHIHNANPGCYMCQVRRK
jgi:hypothetical protein